MDYLKQKQLQMLKVFAAPSPVTASRPCQNFFDGAPRHNSHHRVAPALSAAYGNKLQLTVFLFFQIAGQ